MTNFLAPEVEWFLVGLFCMIAELIMPGFVIVFFGVGAWVTALLAWVGLLPGFESQMVVFLLTTVVSLLLLRKRGQEMFRGRVSGILRADEEMDDFAGGKGLAVSDIVPGAGGMIEFRGTQWKAESGQRIPQGTPVRVIRKDNITLVVEPNSPQS